MAHLLWSEVMKYSPADPLWSNRDRFVLSNGHGCALQYSMLHLTGCVTPACLIHFGFRKLEDTDSPTPSVSSRDSIASNPHYADVLAFR